MKAKQIIAATVLALTGAAAFAAGNQVGGEAYVSFPIPNTFSHTATSEKTKAEVKAELVQARAEGHVVGGEEYVSIVGKNTNSTVSRADVKAEAIKAAKNGSHNTEYSFGG
ncbi:DUF4148 domain-containing protein [Undibacterium terreum]|uniref:DUF4148 domain-containing protein n=1 Tax=Undibacterium terreum TaxID=1224302 RepID=A0A916U705_9BURK|nr:DUF4148 domain-containing protein [Undibacterium terreum]GGC62177.1 hypothetical protein GCM10011396_06290 [Undibacterium terreum]